MENVLGQEHGFGVVVCPGLTGRASGVGTGRGCSIPVFFHQGRRAGPHHPVRLQLWAVATSQDSGGVGGFP